MALINSAFLRRGANVQIKLLHCLARSQARCMCVFYAIQNVLVATQESEISVPVTCYRELLMSHDNVITRLFT